MKRGRKDFLWILWGIITIVALLHLIRALFNWSLIIEVYPVPVWLSYVVFIILAVLSYKLFKFLKK